MDVLLDTILCDIIQVLLHRFPRNQNVPHFHDDMYDLTCEILWDLPCGDQCTVSLCLESPCKCVPRLGNCIISGLERDIRDFLIFFIRVFKFGISDFKYWK